MKKFKECLEEDGAAAGIGGGSMPVNNVSNVAGSGDPRLPPSQREPGGKKSLAFKSLIKRKKV